jgi:hypothetical protein
VPFAVTSTVLGPSQRDLLLAAFCDDDEAVAAWRRWRGTIDWDDHHDYVPPTLLPQLYRNLSERVTDDPVLPRLKGVRRRVWYENRCRIARLEPVFSLMAGIGAEALLLPRATVLTLDPFAAVAKDARLACVLPRERAGTVFRLLPSAGWHPDGFLVPRFGLDGFALARDASRWRNADGDRLELLWQPAGMPALLDDIRQRSRSGLLGSAPVRLADATDIVHRVLLKPPASDPMQRISILLLCLAALQDEPDWQRLRDQTLVYPAAPDWPDYLAEIAPLLARWGAGDGVAVHCRATQDKPESDASGRTFAGRLRGHWSGYRSAWGAAYSPLRAVCNLPGYLMGRWDLPHGGALPVRILRGLRSDWRQTRPQRSGG